MTYTAPVRELDFMINQVIGLSEINSLPGFEDATEDLVAAILEAVSYTHLTLPTTPYV